MKACIHCTQPIQDEALICKHCKKRQDEPVMRSLPPAGQKACVHCGQMILAEAVLCKHCKKQQSAPAQKEETRAVREVSSIGRPAVVEPVAPMVVPPPSIPEPMTAVRPAPETPSMKIGGDSPVKAGPGLKKMLMLGGGLLAVLLVIGLAVLLRPRPGAPSLIPESESTLESRLTDLAPLVGNRQKADELNTMAMNLHTQGQFAAARARWEEAVKADPSWWIPIYNVACAASMLGQTEDAAAFAVMALSRNYEPVLLSNLRNDADLANLRASSHWKNVEAKIPAR